MSNNNSKLKNLYEMICNFDIMDAINIRLSLLRNKYLVEWRNDKQLKNNLTYIMKIVSDTKQQQNDIDLFLINYQMINVEVVH